MKFVSESSNITSINTGWAWSLAMYDDSKARGSVIWLDIDRNNYMILVPADDRTLEISPSCHTLWDSKKIAIVTILFYFIYYIRYIMLRLLWKSGLYLQALVILFIVSELYYFFNLLYIHLYANIPNIYKSIKDKNTKNYCQITLFFMCINN